MIDVKGPFFSRSDNPPIQMDQYGRALLLCPCCGGDHLGPVINGPEDAERISDVQQRQRAALRGYPQAWETNQEIVEPTPKCIREVCEAAGKDGWELKGMLAIMLPPSKAARRQERQMGGGLMLSETVRDEAIAPALAAQLEAANNQPVPAVMLIFQRPTQEQGA